MITLLEISLYGIWFGVSIFIGIVLADFVATQIKKLVERYFHIG